MLPETAETSPTSTPATEPTSTPATEPTSASLRRSTNDTVAIFSEQSSATDASNRQKLCGACHFSCLKCRSANDYDCSACAPDAQLTERATNETYCLPIVDESKLKMVTMIASKTDIPDFLIVLVIVLSLIVVVLLFIFIRNCVRGESREVYTYDKLATNAALVKAEPILFLRTAEDNDDNDDSSDSDENGGVERR